MSTLEQLEGTRVEFLDELPCRRWSCVFDNLVSIFVSQSFVAAYQREG
jgi:hypothetical protein